MLVDPYLVDPNPFAALDDAHLQDEPELHFPSSPISQHSDELPDWYSEGDLSDIDVAQPPPEPDPQPLLPDVVIGPWSQFGLPARPNWWHYYEERQQHDLEQQDSANDVDRLDDDEQQAVQDPIHQDLPGQANLPPAAAMNALQGAPLQPDLPEPDDDSPTWAQYWTRRRAFDAWSAQREPAVNIQQNVDAPPPPQREDFACPGLQAGPWCQSDHVETLVTKGFSISVDITKRGKAPPVLRCKNDAETAYIQQMIDDGILERGPVDFCTPHFFIYKPGKLRLIFNGKKLNSAVKTPPKFNMKSHATRARMTQEYKFHASDDLRNMFYSNIIAPESRPHFGIRTSLGTFRYTRMPFGFSWSPFVAHISSDEIAKRAIEAGHAVTHYLDDFDYFGNTVAECLAARSFCRKLFKEAGYIINFDKATEPSSTYTSLGLQYDLVNKTVQAKPKYLPQMRAVHLNRVKANVAVSRKEVAGIVGSLVFLNNAYPGSLSYLSALIAFLKAGGDNWRKSYKYSCISQYVEQALRTFETFKPCKLQVHEAAPQHIYTDATNTQLGVVLPDVELAVAIPHTQIYRAEAEAVRWALCQPSLPEDFVLRVDNLALVHALRKGRSNIRQSNQTCAELLQLRLTGSRISTKWIATDKNPADHPSRRTLAPRELFVSPKFAEGA